jgi:hypothetical protein
MCGGGSLNSNITKYIQEQAVRVLPRKLLHLIQGIDGLLGRVNIVPVNSNTMTPDGKNCKSSDKVENYRQQGNDCDREVLQIIPPTAANLASSWIVANINSTSLFKSLPKTS